MEQVYYTPSEQRQVDTRLCAFEARKEFGIWLASLRKWDSFITLTYDPKRPQLQARDGSGAARSPSSDEVRHHLLGWFSSSRKSHQFSNFSVAAVQSHKNGWPHVHVLAETGDPSREAALGWCHDWYREHGYARWETPASTVAVTAYVARYLTRIEGDLWFWPQTGRDRLESQRRIK